MGLYKTLDRLCPNLETRIKIDAQIEKFDKAEGLFGYNLAIATRDKKQPGNYSYSFNYVLYFTSN